MKTQFDKLFGTGKEYDEIDGNGDGNETNPVASKKTASKKTAENQMDLFGFSDDENSNENGLNKFYQTLEDTPHFYQIIQGDFPVKLLLQNLLQQTSVCFDTETTGIDALNAELVGLSFSREKGKGFYVPFPENQDEAKELIEKFIPFFENETIEKIGQNMKYDLKILSNYNIIYPAWVWRNNVRKK